MPETTKTTTKTKEPDFEAGRAPTPPPPDPLQAFIAESIERIRVMSSRGLPTVLPTFDTLGKDAMGIAAEVNHLADLYDASVQQVADLNAQLDAYVRAGRAAETREAAAKGIDPPDDREPQIRAEIAQAQARQRQFVQAQGPILFGPEMRTYLAAVYAMTGSLEAEIKAKLGKVIPALKRNRDQLTEMRDDIAALRWTRQPGKGLRSGVEWAGETAVTDAITVLESYLV